MSNEKHNKKKNLLDVKKLNPTPIILICISVVALIAIFGSMWIDQEDPDTKQKNDDVISISFAGSSLVDETQYNIWFNINCRETSGSIRLEPSTGFVMKVNITNESDIQIAEEVDLATLDQYSYIWITDYTGKDFVGYMDAKFEDRTQIKTASIYAIFSGSMIGFLDKDQYEEYKTKIEKAQEQLGKET